MAVDDPELELLADAALFRSAQESGLGDAFERAEVRDVVQTAIGALPDAFRDVALLVELHDRSYDAASIVRGIPVGTVRSRLFGACRLLQERLLTHARDAGFGLLPTASTTRGSSA